MVSYTQKEDILHLARNHGQLQHEGSPIQIFQDLSAITLQHRRELRPLLNVLRNRHHIVYRWKYPFCLVVTVGDRTALLHTPIDLRAFCDTLGIPLVAVPEWYSSFMQSKPWLSTQQGLTCRSQRYRQRCHRSTSNSLRRNADDITDHEPKSSPSSALRKTGH